MNQKPGHTDWVSCPTMEIPGRRITYRSNSGAKEKHQLDPGGPRCKAVCVAVGDGNAAKNTSKKEHFNVLYEY